MIESNLIDGREGDLRYLARVPRRASLGDAAPALLCFLHGFDEAAPRDLFEALTRHGPLRPGSPPSSIDKLVIVAPQLPVAGDLWHTRSEAVQRLVAREARAAGCDQHRLYLSGFSFGGNGVFDLAMSQPGFWAALWSVDPTRVPMQPLREPIWLSAGEIARRSRAHSTERLKLESAPDEGPVRGDRIWRDEDLDHVETAASAFADARIYRWLLAHQLQPG